MTNFFCGSAGCLRFQRGFSLVELMVAMVIALLVMAGVVNSFLAGKEANRLNDELAYIQENARYALDMLSRDVRQAGDFGCSATAYGGTENNYVANSLISVVKPATTSDDLQALPLYKRVGIEGFDHSATGAYPALIPNKISDALIVRRGDSDPDRRLIITSHDDSAGSFQIKNPSPHTVPAGTFLVASDTDCRHQAIFQMTGPSTASPTTVEYAGTGVTPGNCTKILRGDRKSASTYYKGDCSDTPTAVWKSSTFYSGQPYNFRPGSWLMPIKGTAYYIAPSSQDSNMRSLWVRSLQKSGISTAEELAEGVVEMRITYGVNISNSVTGSDPPNIVYTTANNIVADEPDTSTIPPASLLVWNRVVAVRIQLLMRSRNAVLPTAQSHDYSSVFGSDYQNFSDRFIYQVVSTTVAVRNAFRG